MVSSHSGRAWFDPLKLQVNPLTDFSKKKNCWDVQTAFDRMATKNPRGSLISIHIIERVNLCAQYY